VIWPCFHFLDRFGSRNCGLPRLLPRCLQACIHHSTQFIISTDHSPLLVIVYSVNGSGLLVVHRVRSSTSENRMDWSGPVPQPDECQHASQIISLYTGLDLSTNSIRLIHIYPELSHKGYIQCEMRNATIESDYTCLSYVWGKPDEGHPVLINGEWHTVRRNLLDFLRRARKKQFGWLWIVLCALTRRTLQIGRIRCNRWD
jgi:hypothetical protein